MRGPIDVKAHFRVYGSGFNTCCYLSSVRFSHVFGGSWAEGLRRSHLDSAAEPSCAGANFLGQGRMAFWLLRSDSYTRLLTDNRWNLTANLRARAANDRFLAF